MKIKELAKEIRNVGDAYGYCQEKRIVELLDLIDGAKECEDFRITLAQRERPGTTLFFPDPQPTLEELAEKILPGCTSTCCWSDVINEFIKAALKRETNE